jgi:hypothetical protein
MKVFISWSGERSRAIADVMRRWLPSVLQSVRPYFSPDDVAKGSRWSSEIAKELEEVLGLTRRLASDRERRFDLSHPVWDDLL